MSVSPRKEHVSEKCACDTEFVYKITICPWLLCFSMWELDDVTTG